jgi:hypothetical protein
MNFIEWLQAVSQAYMGITNFVSDFAFTVLALYMITIISVVLLIAIFNIKYVWYGLRKAIRLFREWSVL